MKIKRIKGFSLAEVLISLTVVSLVMAAAAPVLTKKTDIGDVSWKWTNGPDEKLQNGTVFNRDAIIIGDTNPPKNSELMQSEDTGLGTYFSSMYPQIYGKRGADFIEDADTLSKKSKITIIKNRTDRNGFGQNFVDSHIALYNLGGADGSVQYAGKLASDQYNLALGIGALQSLDSNAIDLNTLDYKWDDGSSKIEHQNYKVHGVQSVAIGHYSMAKTTGWNEFHHTLDEKDDDYQGGDDNVALGYNSMYDGKIGRQNTAVGYNALAKTVDLNENRDLEAGAVSNNTVVGNFLGTLNTKFGTGRTGSSHDIISGNNNVVIGNYDNICHDCGTENILKTYIPTGTRIDPVIAISSLDNFVKANNQGYVSDGEKTINYTRHRFGNNNVFIGHNAGRGLPTYDENSIVIGNGVSKSHKTEINKYTKFNTGSLIDPLFENTIAIGNVVPDANIQNADQRVEIIQVKQGKNPTRGNKAERKVVINGDLTIRSIDGKRTIFKVDGSGVPIGFDRNHAKMTKFRNDAQGTSGPDRCEGAEICIGKFSLPKPDGSFFLFNGKDYVNDYDVYIRTMAVGYDRGSPISISGLQMIPYLKTALLYLDRFKDTNGIVINYLNNNRLSNISEILGVDLLGLIGITSDARLKNIYGDSNAGLKEIEALKIKSYVYKADKSKTPHVGVIAQELQKIFPNSVHKGSDGYLSITQEEMFYGLVKSIQELSAKNNQVEEKIALTDEQIKITNEQNNLLIQENKLLEKQNKEFAKRIAKLKKTANKTN